MLNRIRIRSSIPIDQLEHLSQHIEQNAPAFNLPRFIFMALGEVQDLLHLSVQSVEDIGVHQTQQDQESRTDRGPDNAANRTEAVEALRHSRGGSCHYNRGDDDNPVRRVSTDRDLFRQSASTHVEWPSEKKVPTVTGLWPPASSRLVIKSIAWSFPLASV